MDNRLKHIIWKLNGLSRLRLRQSTLNIPIYSGTLPAPSQMCSQEGEPHIQENMALTGYQEGCVSTMLNERIQLSVN